MHPSIKILDVFIGNICNLACQFCDTRSDTFRKGEYDTSLENVKESIDLAVKYFKIEHFSLLGGEPLLYKQKIIEILKHIRSFDKDTPINIATNGMLLSKNIDFIANIIEEYSVCIMVSDHVSKFKDKTKSNQILASVHELGKVLGYKQKDPIDWYNDYHDFKNKKQDPLFQAWLEKKQWQGRPGDEEDSIYYGDGNRGVVYVVYDWFYQNYYLDENNKPKPFNSHSADDSFINGCCSEFCSFLYDKKLYKCGALGTLKRFLTHHNVADDPEWQKYLAYKPVDLTNCTPQEVQRFSDTKHTCIKECTMCPATSSYQMIKTEEKVLPILRNVQAN